MKTVYSRSTSRVIEHEGQYIVETLVLEGRDAGQWLCLCISTDMAGCIRLAKMREAAALMKASSTVSAGPAPAECDYV